MEMVHLMQLDATLRAADIEVPDVIVRALKQIELANGLMDSPASAALTMTPANIRHFVTDSSIRLHQGFQEDTRGLRPGVDAFTAKVLAEAHDALLPEMETIVTSLRPQFEEITRVLQVAAQDYDFTLATTSDHVIDLKDETASQVWRDSREAWKAAGPITRLRIVISEVLDVAPTKADMMSGFHSADEVDFSVAFAAHENWSIDGAYNINRKPRLGLDWFALGVRGITLNTPSEVREKLTARRSGV